MSTPAFHELETPAGIGGVGCVYAELERPERVRFSPVQSDPPILDKDQEGQSGGAVVLMVASINNKSIYRRFF